LGRRTPAPLSRSILDEGGEHARFALGQLGSDRLERASVEALEVEHSEQHDDEQHQREEHEEAAVRQRRGVGRHAVGEEAADRVLAQLCRLNDFRAQAVVLAAGVATAALGAPLGIRVRVDPSPATLFRLRAPAGLVRTVVNTQDFDLRQVATDRLLAAADSPERTLAAVRSTFRGAANVELLSTRVGVRPMPADGEPIVGPVAELPGLYLAVMHSAVTLAPAVGRLVARELVDGTVEPALAGCRLDRF
jgi:glycine/D-amino acid oxidase-like deaminating enzyme